MLDGCYALKTDVPPEQADKQTIHARYKDLTHVECCFRDSKTVYLEVRPLYLRLAQRTRGHLLVVMLAYHLIKHLRNGWSDMDITVEKGLGELDRLCIQQLGIDGQEAAHLIPRPNALSGNLLKKSGIKLPPSLKLTSSNVDTRKKLQKNRKGL